MRLCRESKDAATMCKTCGVRPGSHSPLFKRGTFCPGCCPVCAPQPPAPKKAAAQQPVRTPTVPVLHGNPNPSQPPTGDPWYRDTPQDRAERSTGDRGSQPWIPNLPDWFQAGNGRRGQIQTARIIGPAGDVREVAPPDYTPRPFTPER